jgi:hypothetical protein
METIPARIGELIVKGVQRTRCRDEGTSMDDSFLELSEYGGGGRRSFVVIPEGSNGKGWLDCWVQMQRLKGYYDKQGQGRKTEGKQIVVALAMSGLCRDGRSYAAALEGRTTGEAITNMRRGSLSNTRSCTEAKMESPQSKAKDHIAKAGVSTLKMEDVMKLNMGDAKDLEDLKSFLRFFKREAECWLGLLELGLENKDVGESGGLQVGLVSENVTAKCEDRLKQEDPMLNETCVDEHTTRLQLYSHRSPCKVMPQWRVKLEESITSLDSKRLLALEAVQSERAELDPRSGAEVVAGMVLLAGTSSAGPQAISTEKWSEVVDEVVEGEYLAKAKDKELSAVDGGTSVCLDVGQSGVFSEAR